MTILTLTVHDPAKAVADVLVIGAYAGEEKPVAADAAYTDAVNAAALAGAVGKAGELTLVPGAGTGSGRLLAVVGLGERAKFTAEVLRKGAGIASRALAGSAAVVSTLSLIDLAAAAQGHLLGAYVFDRYKAPAKPPVETIALAVPEDDDAVRARFRTAVITAEGVLLARDLVNTAPNELYPAAFADRATTAAETAGLVVEVLDEQELKAAGFGGIVAVGSGSVRPPRLVRITYSPA